MSVLNAAFNIKVHVKNTIPYKSIVLIMFVLAFGLSACADYDAEYELNMRQLQYDECNRRLGVKGAYDIVFIGDSITWGGEFESRFSDKSVVNLGICADTIKDVSERLCMLYSAKPQKIFIMIGINSLRISGENVNACLIEYDYLMSIIKENLPSAQVFIESVLPTSIAHGEIVSNPAVSEFNSGLVRIAEKYSCEFIDLHSFYKTENGLNLDLTYDGLHLNKTNGYELWYSAAAQFIY